MRVWLVLFLLIASPLWADERVVVGLSQNRVALTVNFEGSEILIYGAVRRDRATDPDSRLDVIVTVEGPPTPSVIWRKARRWGIWVNSDSQIVRAAPSFYAVASTAPLAEILPQDEDLTHRISTRLAIFEARGAEVRDAPGFTDALIRIRERQGLYKVVEQGVNLQRETLFSTRILLPKTIVEGSYGARIFLLRDGVVIDEADTVIDVRKAVLERWLYNLAYDQPFLYGLMALGLAVFAGWGAAALFRLGRN
ncbi:MAG: TIGR02186 family protein [Roseinatronobacter sp.]